MILMESVITWIYEKQLFKGMARGVSQNIISACLQNSLDSFAEDCSYE